MKNLLYLPQALRNALRMSPEERARRMMSALVSRDIYDAGKLLEELASRVDGEFSRDVQTFIQDNEILKVEKVWELEEANRLRDEVAQYIKEAQTRLEEESNG